MHTARALVGGTPAEPLRPVSLAAKRYMSSYTPEAVLVAVSGGPDSVALAVALLALADRPEVSTVTVDHGVRKNSDAEANSVAALMKELGAHNASVVKVKLTRGGEGGARDARYAALTEAASALAPKKVDVLLGHTMDDQAETVLLRLGRGASLRALAAMRPRRRFGTVSLGRPLLGVRRADTHAFCEYLGLPVVDDPTNYTDGPWQGKDGNPLRRAAVREKALPALSEALAQDVVPALARFAAQAGEDEDALRSLMPQRLEHMEKYPAALRKRALLEAAVQEGSPAGQLTSTHVAQMDALITDWHGQGPVHLPGGVRAWREKGQLHVQGES